MSTYHFSYSYILGDTLKVCMYQSNIDMQGLQKVFLQNIVTIFVSYESYYISSILSLKQKGKFWLNE